MFKQKEIPHSFSNAQALIEEQLQQFPSLVLQQLNSRTFKIVSKQNFGYISMAEKEHFTIKGKFKAIEEHTQISYEVKGNATFSIFSIVFPIMFLPTLIIGAAGGNTDNLLTSLMIYLLICGLVIFFLLNLEKQYRRKGEQEFEAFLNLLERTKKI